MNVDSVAHASSRGGSRALSRPVAALLLLLATVVGLVACGSDPEPEEGSAADAYARVVRWFVDTSATSTSTEEDETAIVFVEPRGEGMTFGVEMQAEIISATAPFADVRFIDDRSEALGDGGVVRDGAIFLALGPSTPKAGATTIECDQIESEERSRSLVFELRWRRQGWVLVGEPTVTG